MYSLYDGQGNERTVTNSGQSVTGTINYDAFGNTVGSTGSSASSFMYGATSGYQNNDDAGLTYIAARYYDSAVGRFTTRDTHLDQHPYLYCDHDPVNCVDPSGHDLREKLRAAWLTFTTTLGIGVGTIIGGGGAGAATDGPGLVWGAKIGGAIGGGIGTFIGHLTADPVLDTVFDPGKNYRQLIKMYPKGIPTMG